MQEPSLTLSAMTTMTTTTLKTCYYSFWLVFPSHKQKSCEATLRPNFETLAFNLLHICHISWMTTTKIRLRKLRLIISCNDQNLPSHHHLYTFFLASKLWSKKRIRLWREILCAFFYVATKSLKITNVLLHTTKNNVRYCDLRHQV